LTSFEDIGLYFEPTPGDDINEGIQAINDALNYDETKPVDFYNKPRLLISSECPNLIFALQTWTGRMVTRARRKTQLICRSLLFHR
jgi:hypothetical protein